MTPASTNVAIRQSASYPTFSVMALNTVMTAAMRMASYVMPPSVGHGSSSATAGNVFWAALPVTVTTTALMARMRRRKMLHVVSRAKNTMFLIDKIMCLTPQTLFDTGSLCFVTFDGSSTKCRLYFQVAKGHALKIILNAITTTVYRIYGSVTGIMTAGTTRMNLALISAVRNCSWE